MSKNSKKEHVKAVKYIKTDRVCLDLKYQINIQNFRNSTSILHTKQNANHYITM